MTFLRKGIFTHRLPRTGKVKITTSLTVLAVAAATAVQGQYCQTPQTNCQNSMADHLEQSKREALWGMLVGDSLAMPVHWYYNTQTIKAGYGGWLSGYRAPNTKHPSSILTLSAVDGSGRKGWGSKSKPVIGHLILHDKLKYWTSSNSNTHYHQGMQAGDSTLNALTALETLKVMQRVDADVTSEPRSLQAAVLENYFDFMTTPGSHNDTYAESFHRKFFQQWSELQSQQKDGESLVKFCEQRYRGVKPSNEDGQIPVIGALVIAVPWVLHHASLSEDQCAKATVNAITLTHPAPSLEVYVDAYSRLLYRVLHGADLKTEALNTLERPEFGGRKRRQLIEKVSAEAAKYQKTSEGRLQLYQESTGMLGSACYIQGAMTSMLLLAHEFHDDFDNGVLTNANCGGENAHRGAALGALLGANVGNKGAEISRKWKEGLNSGKDTASQIVSAKL